MRKPVVLDAGPLVALLDRREKYHRWAIDQAARLPAPFLTCEAVVSEACFLRRRIPGGSGQVLEFISRGLISLPFQLEGEVAAVAKLSAKYVDVPMSLADACLVRMAERVPQNIVFTLDSDFKLYRKNGNQVIPVLMPDDL